mmetsp:Transcript_86623/g.269240  ORF Transcript_86623/g.269240 Transcript_86623/m.269240 type:complete len:470 (+) Transcript_86623:732-2141(+)
MLAPAAHVGLAPVLREHRGAVAGPALLPKPVDVPPDVAEHVGVRVRADHLCALLALGHSRAPGAALLCGPRGLVVHIHVRVDPWQGPALRVRLERLVWTLEPAAPSDAPMLGGPIRVDVVLAHGIHGKGLHRLADGLGTEGGDLHAVHRARLDLLHCLWRCHNLPQERAPSLEDCDLVLPDHLGKPGPGRLHGVSAHEHGGDAGGEHGGYLIALPGDPAERPDRQHAVGGWVGVEHDLHGLDQPHGGAVDVAHALRLARRPRGEYDKHGVVGLQRHRSPVLRPDRSHGLGPAGAPRRGPALLRCRLRPRLSLPQRRWQPGLQLVHRDPDGVEGEDPAAQEGPLRRSRGPLLRERRLSYGDADAEGPPGGQVFGGGTQCLGGEGDGVGYGEEVVQCPVHRVAPVRVFGGDDKLGPKNHHAVGDLLGRQIGVATAIDHPNPLARLHPDDLLDSRGQEEQHTVPDGEAKVVA